MSNQPDNNEEDEEEFIFIGKDLKEDKVLTNKNKKKKRKLINKSEDQYMTIYDFFTLIKDIFVDIFYKESDFYKFKLE
jgi:hypothetical protein